jgi:membrane-anchored mycosin MYCP
MGGVGVQGHRYRWVLAALVALGVVVGSAPPAVAAKHFHPRADEWWFAPWSIEQKVWPVTQGQGVTVAVLGGGVNTSLPEIADAVLPGGDMLGRNSDGHTDLSEYGHSTSMAALIAGQGGGRSGFVGIAPRAKILPVGVDGGKVTTADLEKPLADGVRFAVDKGAQVISMSLGAYAAPPDFCPPEVMAAVAYAVQHNVVLVAAAGNEGDTDNASEFPGSCPGVLTVGATDDYSRPWKKTQAHDYVSVAAPGVDVTTIGKDTRYFYEHTEGTSNSAALVSAAAALVRSANPRMPAPEVVRRLIATALDVNTPGPDNQTGYGIVRISRAMDPSYAVAADFPNPPYQRFDQWQNPTSGTSTATHLGTSQRRPGERGPSTALIVLVLVAGVGAVAGLGWLIAAAVRRRRSTGAQPAFASAPQDQAGGRDPDPAHPVGTGE